MTRIIKVGSKTAGNNSLYPLLTGCPHYVRTGLAQRTGCHHGSTTYRLRPHAFPAALCLRNAGVLTYLDRQGKRGATLDDITENSSINEYAASVLLDMGLSGRIITHKEGHYYLAKVGHFLLHDAMTRINMDFTRDVCYQGLFYLENALKEGKPSGLKIFGDWPTIYPALSQLPQAARDSWFAFDHYYSDGAFDAALPYVFASRPATLYDVGGNTGKWALRCCQYDENIAVTLLDLPQQIALARKNIENAGLSHRIDFHAVDMLGDTPLRRGRYLVDEPISGLLFTGTDYHHAQ